jgi:acyl-CoA synthetase (NDP forming)
MTERSLADALLRPDAVAIYGASADPAKNTGRPQRFLKAHGYAGRVVPINPNRDEVQGVPAYPTLAEANAKGAGGVEQALIMVPKRFVLAAVEDCAAAGVKVATIYSDGFAETGADGMAEQKQIVAAANAGGMRIIGPNSMGTIDLNTPMTLSINAILEMESLPAGRLGVISQSGSILGAMISRGAARGIGFSSLLSIGNEADLGVGELMEILVDDGNTDAILLFMEGIRDAAALGRAARRAHAAGKPVIAYKLGRSDVGRELAVSHSGAVAGPDAAIDALLRHHGIMRVDMMETLLELPRLALGSEPAQGPGRGKRVAVVTTTGGGAAMVVDRLGASGLELVAAPDRLHARLAEFGLDLGHGRLIDLTMAGTREGVYGAALEVLLTDDGIDAVVAVVGSSGQFHPELAVAPIVAAPKTGKPLAAFIAPDAPESLAGLAAGGVAAFRTPEACADAVRTLLNHEAPASIPDLARPEIDIAGAEPGTLDEARSRRVMADLGIPVSRALTLSGPDAGIPGGIFYPVAAKVVSPDLPHKTEAGAVALGLNDAAALKTAMAAIWGSAKSYAPDARLEGILVEPMVSAVAEVLLGYRLDAEAGPVVVLGMGGVTTEIYEDAAVRPAPVDEVQARAMIADVKGLAVIRGYRNLPEGDVPALASAVSALSRLALLQGTKVLEAEINPLMVGRAGTGVIAVDALVRLGA